MKGTTAYNFHRDSTFLLHVNSILLRTVYYVEASMQTW